MERFIRRQNVRLYHRLLQHVTDESDRQKILHLLAEERLKQKDAGDQVGLLSREDYSLTAY